MEAEATLQYSRQRYPLREALTEVLRLPCELEGLHGVLPHFSPLEVSHSDVMQSKTELLLPLTDEERAEFDRARRAE